MGGRACWLQGHPCPLARQGPASGKGAERSAAVPSACEQPSIQRGNRSAAARKGLFGSYS
jgi:hypothetical protein